MIVACNDDPILRRLMPKIRRRMLSYGTRKGSDFQITLKHSRPCRGGPPGAPTPENNRSTRPLNIFAVKFRDRDLGEFQLHVPGVHNVLNATAAIAVGIGLDISIEKIHEALESFRGVDRRFQLRGKAAGVAVIDDYGHHPTEIRATLAAARQCGYRKIHVIFQPHRYTRTRDLMDEFTTAFSDADSLTVLDIYPASEQPIEGITGEALASRIAERWNTEASGNSASPNGGDQSMVAPPFSRSLREGGSAVRYVSSFEEAVSATTAEACEGDMILTLGAGSVSQLGSMVVERLAAVPHDVKRALTPSV
jgi:UDP-N-acetylmuramate--alanine ligase